MPIEVKSNLKSDKITASFLGFIKRYKPKKALIVNLAYQGKRKVKDTIVYFIYPWDLKNYLLM